MIRHPDESTRSCWVIAVVVAVLFTVLGTPRLAYAHNGLIGTSPEDGSTVATPPAEIVLTFNEPAIATGTKVLVTGPSGSVAQGEPRLVDTTVRQELQRALPAGQYTVEWRVTSADGHPINGSFTFRARAGARVQTDGSATPAAAPTPTVGTSTTQASPTTPAAPAPATGGNGAGWLWLLAIIPVALALALGWRFSRRRS